MEKAIAVKVRHGYKSYSGSEKVLNNINITVNQGSIYAIIGASGSGKTTLLSCILSLQSLDLGNISVFGKKPGSKECGIPGTLVGYMPQETALYEYLKISDMLWYYGALYGMKKSEISSRISFLKTFLQLPKLSRFIISLSGGQCRRVSLALALIHQPKLLILDEPSVGLDPLLRERIWDHLKQLAALENVTIIVTTHYVSESLHCDKVGILRNGRMVAEESPKELLNHFGGNDLTLDEVVVKLCKKDEAEGRKVQLVERDIKITIENQKQSEEISDGNFKRKFLYETDFWDKAAKSGVKQQSSMQLIFVVGCKNLMVLWRHWVVLSFLLIIPPLNSIILETTVGRDPKGLNLNYVISNANTINGNCNGFNKSRHRKPGCFLDKHFSICNFLQKLSSKDLNIIESANEAEALTDVEKGDSIGYLKFGQNYSQHLQERLLFGNWAGNETLLGAEIKIRLDLSNAINSLMLKAIILEEYKNSLKAIVEACGQDERLVDLPLKFGSLYGNNKVEEEYITFVRPFVLVLMMFVMGNFTGAIYTTEKRLGVQSRGFVAGIKFYHQLLASLLSDSIILLLQALSIIFMMTFVYGAVFKGSMTLCLLIAYFCALSGVMISILISTFVNTDLQMIQMLVLMSFLNLTGSGALWPLECIPWIWRIICYGLPLTLPLDSLRCVMFYGWGISHPKVLVGLGTSFIWVVGSGIITVIIHRKR